MTQQQSTFKQFKTFVRVALENKGVLPVRSDFLKHLPKNGVGAELGVFQGKFSKELITTTLPRTIHLIDPWWTMQGEFYGDWSRYHNNGELLSTRTAFEQAKAAVAEVDTNNSAVFHVEDDVAILKRMEKDYLDWAYVDSTHEYGHTVRELEELERIVKPKGVIAGHDWRPEPNHKHYGVYKAVNEFCEKYHWEIIAIDKKYTQWAIKRKS